MPLAVAALGHGGRVTWRERRRRPVELQLAGGDARVDGRPVSAVRVAWRGRLAFVSWTEPETRRRRRLVWWPDTLPPSSARELRLAAPAENPPRNAGSVAP